MLKKFGRLVGVGALTAVFLMGNRIQTCNASEEKITLRLMHYYGNTDTDVSSEYLKDILRSIQECL